MHRKLKLSGDGTTFGTELTDLETGVNLFELYAIESVRVETDSRCVGSPRVVLVLDPRFVSVQLDSTEQPFLDIPNTGIGQCNGANGAIR